MNDDRSVLRKFALLLFILGSSANSQDIRKKSDVLEARPQNVFDASGLSLPSIVLEGVLNPEQYIVGPSDVFSINIWTVTSLNLFLRVTPEGTLVIPTVGEVDVAGISLSDAKKKVIAEVKKKYSISPASVTLVSPRDIAVTVLGSVRAPGRYVANATHRVEYVIQEANKPANPNFQFESASKRNIILRRRDGSSLRVDIQKFYATKEDRWNPLLHEGDQVFVARVDPVKNIIAVYGGINAPGRFEYVAGDSILDAIHLAFGFTARANTDSIELARFDPATGKLRTRVVSLQALQRNRNENLPLEPGDRIVVKEKIDLREDYRVTIEGEVRYPGTYPITRDQTRLSDLIAQAGGLTEYASLSAAELLRKSVTFDEAQLARLIKQRSNISPEENSYITIESDLKIRQDNVSVNFEKLFLANDTTQDLVLQTEDRIIIPSTRKTVYVFGQVISPGNVPFVSGRSVEYYIAKAGGFTEDARTGDVAVIKWTTRQWFEPKQTQIEEGDFVWVPPVVRRPVSYWLNIVSQTASVVSVSLSIILLVLQLQK